MPFGFMSPRGGSDRAMPATGARTARPDHTGWLYKKGEGNTAFKHRYFTLSRRTLAYYEDEKATTAKGEIDLSSASMEATVTTEGKTGTSGRYRFEITTLDNRGDLGRTFVLEAADEATRTQWLSLLEYFSVKDVKDARPFPEGIELDQVVGPCPNSRTWRQEWVGMRMEQLRHQGATHMANRSACGESGAESLTHWMNMRAAAIDWKKSQGWDHEHALAYTLLTGCNRAALARSVRDKSGQYAASIHLISRALASRVNTSEPAPDCYYYLLGRSGLATSDSMWSALLSPAAKAGLKTVTTSPTIARDDPKCFPPALDEAAKSCAGFHDKFLAGKDAAGETQYAYGLMPSPVVRLISKPSTPGRVVQHHTLVRVDGAGNRWELPPLATITLEAICEEGTWGAHEAKSVMRKLYVVSVTWTASTDGDDSDADSDDEDKDGVLVPSAADLEIS